MLLFSLLGLKCSDQMPLTHCPSGSSGRFCRDSHGGIGSRKVGVRDRQGYVGEGGGRVRGICSETTDRNRPERLFQGMRLIITEWTEWAPCFSWQSGRLSKRRERDANGYKESKSLKTLFCCYMFISLELMDSDPLLTSCFITYLCFKLICQISVLMLGWPIV